MENSQISNSLIEAGQQSIVAGKFSIAHFSQIVEQAPVGISITDSTAQILYVNKHFCEITGYSQSEIENKNHSVLSFKTTPVEVYRELWETIQAGNAWSGNLVNRRKNGERYLAEVSIAPLIDTDATHTYYMGIQRDVSERFARQTELSNRGKLLQGVFNTVHTGIALLDDKQRVVMDNLAYKTLASDIGEEPAPLLLNQIKLQLGIAETESIDKGYFRERTQIVVELKTAEYQRWFSCRLSNLEMNDSEVDDFFAPKTRDYTVLTVADVTQSHRQTEKRRLAELQYSTAESERLHAMQETVHAVIHQMQAPVNMIESAVNMLNGHNQTCSGIEAMSIALDAGKNALQQLRDARPERPHEAKTSVNLNQIVHELSMMTSERMLQRSISFRLALTGTLPAINGKPARLRVAIKQLIDNAIEAIDFSKSTLREIIISTSLLDGEIQVSIDDTGPGISSDLRLKVFQPLYSTKPDHSEGSRGIGLCIVQQVVSEHGGIVEFSSNQRGGCRVQVNLPLREKGAV
ncbi:nitrogen fixation negative regulator NifL [Echinimonas agarilytica]|uniref:histidine kinase n=1 Tax=Echinimonas agarilytica TaxID=1215918 RepID=A0AA42B8Q5_9GAMM|nr:nitrogen fixation negative regulator NifL [Echinimonas agarilytica]MCM2680456.1 nitrogen fixation negative regulator NifL [Echinimonas agarilytica]